MKYCSKIFSLVAVFLAGLVLYLLLTSAITLKIDNTHAMAKTVIHRILKKSNNSELKAEAKIVEESGLEDMLIDALPRKYHLKFSYAKIYQLSNDYDKHGKITAKDIGLSSKNQIEKIINQIIVKSINEKMQEDSDQVYHITSIYRYAVLGISLLFLLAAILFIRQRYWASIPLFLGTGSAFGVLWRFCQLATDKVQGDIYQGISFNLSKDSWLGLGIGLALIIGWPIVLKILRRKENSDA